MGRQIFVPILQNGSPPTLRALGTQEQSTGEDSLSICSEFTTRQALDLRDLKELENRPTRQVASSAQRTSFTSPLGQSAKVGPTFIPILLTKKLRAQRG